MKPEMRKFDQLIFLTAFFNLVSPLALGAAAATPSNGVHPHTVCRNCHIAGDGQVATGNNRVATSQKRACIECHPDVLRVPGSNSAYASGHVIDNGLERKIAPLGGQSLDRLDCLSCHVAHFQGQPKLLRLNSEAAQSNNNGGAMFDPATLLCLSCHPVAAEVKAASRHYVRHPVGIPVTKAGRMLDISQLPPLADVKGTPDPSDDVIGCTTCHYPHASKNDFLLRWSIAELSAACLKCHPEVAPSDPGTFKGLVVSR